jgi:hypothetical protein
MESKQNEPKAPRTCEFELVHRQRFQDACDLLLCHGDSV